MSRRVAGVAALSALALAGCALDSGDAPEGRVRGEGQELRFAFPPPLPPRLTCYGTPPDSLADGCCALGTPADGDADGIPDDCEQAIAEHFAPIVHHTPDESNWPASVDWVLARTSLDFYDDACTPDLVRRVVSGPLSQGSLLGHGWSGDCGASGMATSDGTRSDHKHRTFFLEDLSNADRAGSADTRDWVTYVHAYPSTLGGTVVQYWRSYAYNDAGDNHGGDWEGVQVHVDGQFRPTRMWLLGHTAIDEAAWSTLWVEGDHPYVFSEGGGHASHARPDGIAGMGSFGRDPSSVLRQETWSGGRVSGRGGPTGISGGLRNVGERTRPLDGQQFVQYSGLWGSPGVFYFSSGYWGPAFNETGMDSSTHFDTAWCHDMASARLASECYPTSVSP